ncbi:hypothetical protein K1T71_008462 [Dendrolimus kikuchii]|uniref:Uncharacterized protein n=1 Tax=Dendrolimus kikuchii TaxID=765133 RepID=A0ACC1CXB6_9NEOP|nr:hypothetical protein K1T71_008462 [Dendrolimus kikuchii]
MAEETDFNDIIESIFLTEEKAYQESYKEGFKTGSESGNPEAYHLGYHKGAELGRELGYYLGIVTYHIKLNETQDPKYPDKIINQLTKLKELIDAFPRNNSEDHDLLGMTENIRAQYKKTYGSELAKWITNVKAHCISVDNDYCLSPQMLQTRIESWHGEVLPEIKVKEFMTSKKSYEVQTMSRLVASLHKAVKATCCVEAGGGRGYLPVALCLGYNIPSLTVDCDEKTLNSAMERVKIIQKQWHVIAKRIKDGNEERISEGINRNLHRFAKSFITKDTKLSTLVREKFPEYSNEDVKILLTGLHTCGNLGPDSLRIFAHQPWTAGVFNVPCCYHLLTEEIDADMFDVFEKNYGSGGSGQGFPMSEYLRGYNLGRNARMLAAQSIDRVVSQRQLPSESLLYRALLQVIIKDHLPDHKVTEGKLKRVASKCNNFEQYFKMADDILNLNLFNRLPANYFIDIKTKMAEEWKRLVLFYLIRLCLAQVIEVFHHNNNITLMHFVKLHAYNNRKNMIENELLITKKYRECVLVLLYVSNVK